MVAKSANILLVRLLAGCISLYIKNPSLGIPDAVSAITGAKRRVSGATDTEPHGVKIGSSDLIYLVPLVRKLYIHVPLIGRPERQFFFCWIRRKKLLAVLSLCRTFEQRNDAKNARESFDNSLFPRG
jgi:hypothetical protein